VYLAFLLRPNAYLQAPGQGEGVHGAAAWPGGLGEGELASMLLREQAWAWELRISNRNCQP
jgi:hypothetical protein